ncbi:MAG: N-acetylmuramoyl-L-alanine amidase [Bacteroidales bacterium]|jgi:N-acetylmuramoyl-L-alanine amidase|nr:N-acetylmuramoyl-L-alanine amidase [Bacteroidales bacterium]
MEKIIGSIFGAAASATKMLSIGIGLTSEEITARLILAAIVAIPGAVVGYLVTVFMKSCHNRLKTRAELKRETQEEFIRQRLSPQSRKRNLRFILIVLFFALIGFSAINQVKLSKLKANISFAHRDKIEESQIRVAVIAGHGSIINNVYQTKGKQSPEWQDGTKIYEGYSTHMLANDLVSELQYNDIEADILTWNATDISLYQRVFKTNSIYNQDQRLLLISLHHNAQPYSKTADYVDNEALYGWYKGGASGTEVFTSPGKTKSDDLAEFVIYEISKAFPEMKMRVDLTDGDRDKEAGFYILTKTKCPTILIEWGFMTNYDDCKMIINRDSRKTFVEAVTKGVVKYNQSIKQKNIAA